MGTVVCVILIRFLYSLLFILSGLYMSGKGKNKDVPELN
jgi:hypothetical protein